ncbi:MAG: carboxylating nicotinate-nucleotide diphosphorylase [Gammaproteobacteria bacterium]|nr:carboxylating nicotinate-nucleotide diphosphorylase [Gammaproteobacteria bacterium]
MNVHLSLPADIPSTVRRALSEDVGAGDLTAGLIPDNNASTAVIICREPAVLCGQAWFNEVFLQLDKTIRIDWACADADQIKPDQTVCTVHGPSRVLLSGERTALNFLQLLSGTATTTRNYVSMLGNSKTKLLDTRKTIPGLRTAQKYAVACGGGMNHRMGLYDAILIKENHIHAAGSIRAAVTSAKSLHRNIEVEVENLDELQQAIDAGADTVLLDNFNIPTMKDAVKLNAGRVSLEVSGGVDKDILLAIASTGVDYIAVGALTKHVRAIDFSMQIIDDH